MNNLELKECSSVGKSTNNIKTGICTTIDAKLV